MSIELILFNMKTFHIATLMHITVGILALISTANGSGFMTLEIKKYINNHGRCSDGTFCDPFGFLDTRESPCDPFFALVVDKSVSGGNGLYNYQTGVYWDVDQVTFNSKFGDRNNPLTIPMNYNDNPGSIQMQMIVMDKDTINADDHMDTFSASLVASADGVKRSQEMISPPMLSQLQIQYWYTCHTDYYGLDCNKFCKAHDDNVNGHYTCDASGNKVCMTGWIGSDCTVRHPCASNPCLHGGTCTNVGGAATCSCPHGITGSRCEIDVNECAESSPCVNGGTCVNSFGGFSCTCPTGFTGRLCEQDINECAESEQCVNGGTCVNSFGNFSCQCPPGITGRRCEEDMDECHSNSCLNGGACVNTFGNFSCKCTEHFTGRLCELDVNECLEPNKCKNNGTCVNNFGNFSCDCLPGFSGWLCDKDIDECAESNPCKNGGTCANTFGNFTCSCKAQFTGRMCELDVNECDGSPCKNGGTCVNRFGGFTCHCPVKYNGHLCENPVCNTTTCANNGSCEVLSDGSVRCHCGFGFGGRRCENTDEDDCRRSIAMCQNGGSCEMTVTGQYRCNCSSGFNGSFCETRVSGSFASPLLSESQIGYISAGCAVFVALLVVGVIFGVLSHRGAIRWPNLPSPSTTPTDIVENDDYGKGSSNYQSPSKTPSHLVDNGDFDNNAENDYENPDGENFSEAAPEHVRVDLNPSQPDIYDNMNI